MSESIHQPSTLANGRSGGNAGINGSHEGQTVDIIRRLTQDQFTADQEGPEGPQGSASTSVMGVLVGEGIKKAIEVVSTIDYNEVAKQFQFMGSGKSEKVNLKLLGNLFASMVQDGAEAAAASDKSDKGASAADESSEARIKALRG